MKTLKSIVLVGMLSLFALNNLYADSPKYTYTWQYSYSDTYFMCINEPVNVNYSGTTTTIALTKKNLYIYHNKVRISIVGQTTGNLYEAKEVYNSSYQTELNGNQSSKYEGTYSIWQEGKFIGLYHVVQHINYLPDGQIEVVLDNYHSECK